MPMVLGDGLSISGKYNRDKCGVALRAAKRAITDFDGRNPDLYKCKSYGKYSDDTEYCVHFALNRPCSIANCPCLENNHKYFDALDAYHAACQEILESHYEAQAPKTKEEILREEVDRCAANETRAYRALEKFNVPDSRAYKNSCIVYMPTQRSTNVNFPDRTPPQSYRCDYFGYYTPCEVADCPCLAKNHKYFDEVQKLNTAKQALEDYRKSQTEKVK